MVKIVIERVGFRGGRGPAGEFPPGTPGQVIGYDAEGRPVAMPMPPASLPQGEPGQLVGYDENGLAMAVDAAPLLSSQQW